MYLLKRITFLLLACLATGAIAISQTGKPAPLPLGQKEAIVFQKNYPFLYYCYTTPAIRQILSKDSVLQRLAFTNRNQLFTRLNQKPVTSDSFAIINALTLQAAEITLISNRLTQLYSSNASFATILTNWLKQCKAYPALPANGNVIQALTQAWQQDAFGINYTIGVYGKGEKPNYPNIDSISFDVHHHSYASMQQIIGRQIYKETDSAQLFFAMPLMATLRILECNGRYNAADFEPMIKTVNAAAVARAKSVNWTKYPYSHILVLGAGADNKEDSLNPAGILRCRLAAIQYFAGRAPFIVLSGGRVHPYKTNYSEAEEMKQYLVNEFRIPANAIMMEPHARHTTTNIRNTARLLIAYGFPMEKPGIVCSTAEHIDAVLSAKFEKRCLKELGYVPYRLGKELSDTETEYYALPVSLRVNPTEPLDP